MFSSESMIPSVALVSPPREAPDADAPLIATEPSPSIPQGDQRGRSKRDDGRLCEANEDLCGDV